MGHSRPFFKIGSPLRAPGSSTHQITCYSSKFIQFCSFILSHARNSKGCTPYYHDFVVSASLFCNAPSRVRTSWPAPVLLPCSPSQYLSWQAIQRIQSTTITDPMMGDRARVLMHYFYKPTRAFSQRLRMQSSKSSTPPSNSSFGIKASLYHSKDTPSVCYCKYENERDTQVG